MKIQNRTICHRDLVNIVARVRVAQYGTMGSTDTYFVFGNIDAMNVIMVASMFGLIEYLKNRPAREIIFG